MGWFDSPDGTKNKYNILEKFVIFNMFFEINCWSVVMVAETDSTE